MLHYGRTSSPVERTATTTQLSSYMPRMNTSQTFPLLAACTTCKWQRCCPQSSSHICSISCLQTSQDTLRIFSEIIPVINDTIADVLPGTCAYSISKCRLKYKLINRKISTSSTIPTPLGGSARLIPFHCPCHTWPGSSGPLHWYPHYFP